MGRRSLWWLSAALHLYVALRLLPALGPSSLAWLLPGLVLMASCILLPQSLLGRRAPLGRRQMAIAWAGLSAMGLLSSLLVLTVLRDMGLLAWAAAGLQWPALGRIGVARPSAWAVIVAAVSMTVIGAWRARRIAPVVSVDVPIAGLPSALNGFRIVQLSDIHVGPTIRQGFVQAIVDRVNTLDADVVALTGDLVDGRVSELREHVAPLGGLRSRHGSFMVTGNHEYYSGADAWVAEFRRLGMRVLLNAHQVVTHDGAALVLAGVTDHGAHHFDPDQRSDPLAALTGAPPQAGARVLLAHQPRSAEAAAAAGHDLQLSGHTHGGQFWPWMHAVRLQQPFTAGLHRLGAMWVYVSRGTGYWGPPNRFGAPSEITLIRLVAA